MTQNQVIVFLMFILLAEVLCMRYWWLRCEAAEKENKKLQRDIERKDRLLARWENGEITRKEEADHE